MKIEKLTQTARRTAMLALLVPLVLFTVCLLQRSAAAQTEEPASVTAPGTVPENREDAAVEADLAELRNAVYCYCGCERETIEVCVCDTAVRIESDFRNKLLAGQTVEQIRTNYLDTYGPQFYAIMPAEGINLLAYIMPAVILVLIGGVAFAVLRKSRQPVAENTTLAAPKQEISDTTVKQVEAELEKYKNRS